LAISTRNTTSIIDITAAREDVVGPHVSHTLRGLLANVRGFCCTQHHHLAKKGRKLKPAKLLDEQRILVAAQDFHWAKKDTRTVLPEASFLKTAPWALTVGVTVIYS